MADDRRMWAMTPLDGRYFDKLAGLAEVVSEAALNRYRLQVETMWLAHLLEEPAVGAVFGKAQKTWFSPNPWQAEGILNRVKEHEATTNHDVKACEYALREELSQRGAPESVLAAVHFACTSEDINNLAYALMLSDVAEQRILPQWRTVIDRLTELASEHAATPMLSRTHGQTASPTTLGKEMAVFGHRLARLEMELQETTQLGKINGAVGAYNAHVVAFPEVDWPDVARRFVEDKLQLAWNPLTTQIENHDAIASFADVVRRANVVMIGMCRDMWGYISLGYFKQRPVAGEVGSSTMPHKINPIDFENAEGNFGVANALATHFTEKLPISRWQRDLSDSTVLRSMGTFAGHAELACVSLLKGLGKVEVDRERLSRDLDQAWEVLGEAIQTVLRRYGVGDAYERLKSATRGQAVTKEALHTLIDDTPELPAAEKTRLKALTPASYVGLAQELAQGFVETRRS